MISSSQIPNHSCPQSKHHFKSLVGSPISTPGKYGCFRSHWNRKKIDPHFLYGILIKQFFERGNPEQHDFNPIAVSQEPRYHRYLRSTRFLLALSSQAQLPEPVPNAGANIYVPEFGLRA